MDQLRNNISQSTNCFNHQKNKSLNAKPISGNFFWCWHFQYGFLLPLWVRHCVDMFSMERLTLSMVSRKLPLPHIHTKIRSPAGVVSCYSMWRQSWALPDPKRSYTFFR